MVSFNKVTIGGYPSGGLTTDKKPFLLANEAFSNLQNAYVWRHRVRKRHGLKGMGRLKRDFFNNYFFPNTGFASTYNILTCFGQIFETTTGNPGKVTTYLPHHLVTGDKVIISGVLTTVPNTPYNNNTFIITVVDEYSFTIGVDASTFGNYSSGGVFVSDRTMQDVETYSTLVPGSVVYTISDPAITTRIYTDNGDGTLTSSFFPAENYGFINYFTGDLTIYTNLILPHTVNLSYSYYPGLPVTGILKQDTSNDGIDNTIFFDTKYSYEFINEFQELNSLIPTIWTGTYNEFFWAANYQGANSSVRLFFATNNNINDPIRYYDNSSWNDLVPIIADNPPTAFKSLMYQALIIIPYYGRLIALNTWEGPASAGTAGASNYYSRCRFSQIGDPTSADAWRQDIFGRGGFLDAPTNESIISAAFFRNTLLVFFEYSTWQLRYIGEYGLPFIFERVSSDFGSTSPYSSIVFDDGVYTVSNRGIIQAGAGQVRRFDDNIPETIFSFEVQGKNPNFVHGIRDYEKEVVYWNYKDVSNNVASTQLFPNTTLLYNYKNNAWAQFRDTLTCFGPVQFQFGITWESTSVFWESEDVTWDQAIDQNRSPYIAAGNQQGYVFIYENQTAQTPVASHILYSPSLFIFEIQNLAKPALFISPNHNLVNGEFVYLTGCLWNLNALGAQDPEINDKIYKVSVEDENTFTLSEWNGLNYGDLYIDSLPEYIGGGEMSLLPVMNIVSKDFNPYQAEGKQFKLSQIDFQMDTDDSIPSIPAMTIQLFVNSFLNTTANIGGLQEYLVNSALTSNFISNADRSNPCTITSYNHSLATGTTIYITGIKGMTELNFGIYKITVVDKDRFSLNGIDSTGYTDYISGGIFNTLPKDGTTYQSGSEYAWYRFYSNLYGQYLRIGITYDDNLMNQITTHQSSMELNAMNIFLRPGGRLTN